MKLPMQDRIAAFAVRRLMPAPVRTRLGFYSMIFSADDDPSRPSQQLIDLALNASSRARSVDLEPMQNRTKDEFMNIWPAEHNRLLAGLIASLQPKVVIEVGAGGALSALVIAAHLPPRARLVTYNVFHCQNHRLTGRSICASRTSLRARSNFARPGAVRDQPGSA
jgi:hypothetical protein